VKPPVSVSTAAAYAELDRRERPRRARRTSVSIEMLIALQRGDFEAVEALLQNDFQNAIAECTPPVARALNALRSAGASNALLAGSGSCVFALARDRTHASAILDRLSLPENYARFSTAFATTPDWRA
jgi:4-diphosphocytidyl-2-C-methyl-D-erythritol kinase